MTYLLDTNVISEPLRRRPSPRVLAWLGALSPHDAHLSVLSLGEIERGVRLRDKGNARPDLVAWAHESIPRQFRGRLHIVDTEIARRWGALSADARTSGRPLAEIDGLLLATAASRGLVLVTRDLADCAGRGVPTLDPWTGAMHAR